MKVGLCAALALVFTFAGPEARGGNTFSGSIGYGVVTVDIGPTGRTTYRFAGGASPPDSGPNFLFTAECAYDPLQTRASERLTERSTGRVVTTSATCPADPWRFVVTCAGTASSSGDSPGVRGALKFPLPITSQTMASGTRAEIVSAYNFRSARLAEDARAAAKAAADKAAAAKAAEATRLAVPVVPAGKPKGSDAMYVVKTPTPDPYKIGVGPLKDDHAAAKYKLGPQTYPPYGASYSPDPGFAFLTVNQTTFVTVTVKNLSSQTWPAGGAFHLAYHWYRGGGEIVHEGARTLMPAAVAPGGSVTLNAKVTAPPSAGLAALRWDMVQENVAWFSDKGVPMSAPQSLTVNP